MKNKEWINHIIDRFKGENINMFVRNDWRCPCNFFSWECSRCEFFGPIYGNDYEYNCCCKESQEWRRLSNLRIKIIKLILRRKLK